MKKIICFIVAFFFYCACFSFFIAPSKAQSEYLRVIDNTTPFYKNKTDSTPLFFLPYTYYVKILDEDQDFFHVEAFGQGGHPALDGFVPKNALFDDQLTVENPYLRLSIYTFETTVLYADNELSIPLQYIFAERELCYYGSVLTNNGNAFFVEYNGRLGYVKEHTVLPFLVPNHPNPLTFLATPEEQAPEQNSDGFLSLRFTIIACLAFAGIIGLFVALGRRKDSNVVSNEYYDENEYSHR